MQSLKTDTAIYCRLSRDDGNVDESQSIQSQKEGLTDYVNHQGWKIVDYYIDDGYSGTDFNRPSFQRLLKDIEAGRIHIVVTKDLSRLGRNYIQMGYYTEEYFPSHQVRYIAVNDNFDTSNEDHNDFVPFKNIMNEWYAKDISKKIRFTLENKAKNGEPRNTVFPIFGYTYNANYERIPDAETAPIVKMIFKEYLQSGSSTQVARILKERKIKIPSYYNAVKYGYNKEKVMKLSEEELICWKSDVIRDIIARNDYLGTYTTARSKSKNYKTKKRYANENAYVFENKYEPLIDRDTWEKANQILKRTRSGLIPIEENVYKGLVICADCGHVMKYDRKKNPASKAFNFYRYYCANKECKEKNSIQIKYLNQIVKEEISYLKDIMLLHKEEFIAFVKQYDQKGRKIETDIEKEALFYHKKKEEIDKYLMQLFEQNVKGNIPHSTYEMMMAKYHKEKLFIEEQIKQLTKRKQQQNIENEKDKMNQFMALFESMNTSNGLTYDMLHSMLHYIMISSRKLANYQRKHRYQVTLVFSFLDPMLKEFIKTYEEIRRNLCKTLS